MFNLSKSSATYGSRMLKDSTSGVAIQDGDLLWAFDDNQEVQCFFQYSPVLGKELVFKIDTIQPFIISLNNHVFSAQLEDSDSWKWIKKTTSETLSGLHSIFLSLPLADDQMAILSGLGQKKSDINLSIDAKSEAKQVEKILSMFQPEWMDLSVDTSFMISDSLLYNLRNTNMLVMSIDSGSEENINQFSKLKNLQNLVLLKWGPETRAGIDFTKFKALSSLSLQESDLRSTRNIRLPVNIRSLFFKGCNSLTDISNVATNTKLATLGFSGCEKLKEISAIKGMKNLTWLSLPPSINQSQFDSLIPSLPSLQVLELIHCDSLKNIDAVKSLKELRSITLADKNIDISSLYTLKNLELLVIGTSSDSDSTANKQMQQLKAQLPKTFIVPGGGFCLGSGWILLIIPMVLLGIFLSKRIRQTPKGLNS